MYVSVRIKHLAWREMVEDLWWLQIDVQRVVVGVVTDESKKFPWLNRPGPDYNSHLNLPNVADRAILFPIPNRNRFRASENSGQTSCCFPSIVVVFKRRKREIALSRPPEGYRD